MCTKMSIAKRIIENVPYTCILQLDDTSMIIFRQPNEYTEKITYKPNGDVGVELWKPLEFEARRTFVQLDILCFDHNDKNFLRTILSILNE